MYPDVDLRKQIQNKLNQYGSKDHHQELERVHLGILRLAYDEPEKLDIYINMACTDFRDLLVAAEYPLSSHPYNLKKTDPERYKTLQNREIQEYDNWIFSLVT